MNNNEPHDSKNMHQCVVKVESQYVEKTDSQHADEVDGQQSTQCGSDVVTLLDGDKIESQQRDCKIGLLHSDIVDASCGEKHMSDSQYSDMAKWINTDSQHCDEEKLSNQGSKNVECQHDEKDNISNQHPASSLHGDEVKTSSRHGIGDTIWMDDYLVSLKQV